MSWETALVLSLMGTSFLFAYLYNTIDLNIDTLQRPIYALWIGGYKLMFLFGAFFMSMLAIFSNTAILTENNINRTQSGVATFINLGFQIEMWMLIIFSFFIVVGGIAAAIMTITERRRPKE